MTYLAFADKQELVALCLSAGAVLLAMLGLAMHDRRLVEASRRALIASGITVAVSAAGLVAAFLDGAYQLEYVFNYSEEKLATPYKIAGLWAGLNGSILFWAAVLGVVGAFVAHGFRRDRVRDPSSRRLEPWVYIVYGVVEIFFLAVIRVETNPFEPIGSGFLSSLTSTGLVANGRPVDGAGLNPLLENYWMLIHPPSLYLGFILYTVPFAYGMAALLSGELSSYWIRVTRRWTMAAWLFNTNGFILGGLWAYEVLGWGGYWAWDPVENSSFLPWLTGTAFLHSVMIQERRDMLRVWNSLLVAITFILSIFGTYLTRSGVVSSVHAFSEGSVGDWFLGFIVFLTGVSLFLIFFRMRDMRSHNTIDHVLSRESVFLLNNFVLLAIAAAIVVLTLWPKISYEFLGQSISVQVPVYNLVCAPFFVLLLFLTAAGPAMGWIRTTGTTLRRNLLLPAIASLPLALATEWIAYAVVRGGDLDDPVSWTEHLYPTLAIVYPSWLILTTIGWEVWRTTRHVMENSGRSFVQAFLRLGFLNNRRYGGYLVHVGLAILSMGVVTSSMYRVSTELRVEEGGTASMGPYDLTVRAVHRDKPVSAYLSTKVHVDVSKNGAHVASLDPEKRFYPETGFRRNSQLTTEVSIARSLAEDFYVYFEQTAQGGGFLFTIFRNPLINLVWFGWILMIAGGLFAAVPLRGKLVGLAG